MAYETTWFFSNRCGRHASLTIRYCLLLFLQNQTNKQIVLSVSFL